MKKLKYQILIFIVALISACRGLSEFDEIDYPGDMQIVVECVLVPGEKPAIRLSELSDFYDTIQKPVSDASVSIYDNEKKYSLDIINENLGEYAYNGVGLEIFAGETYNLEVEYHGNILYAETIIPYPPENIKLDLVTDEYTDSLLDYTFYNYLELSWDSLDYNYYYIAIECDSLNPFADNYCNYFFNDTYPVQYSHQFFDATGLIPENTYKLNIYSMTEDYAQYYYGYELVGSDFGYSGNIENAYGIFTGISLESITFQYFTNSVSIIHK